MTPGVLATVPGVVSNFSTVPGVVSTSFFSGTLFFSGVFGACSDTTTPAPDFDRCSHFSKPSTRLPQMGSSPPITFSKSPSFPAETYSSAAFSTSIACGQSNSSGGLGDMWCWSERIRTRASYPSVMSK